MSSERHAFVAGLLLLAGLLSGCGGSPDGAAQAPVASDQPDGGLAASKQIMNMQPPKPARGK